MGKHQPAKNIRIQLKPIIERNPLQFLDYEKNKSFLERILPSLEKRARNIIAGWMTRYAKRLAVLRGYLKKTEGDDENG